MSRVEDSLLSFVRVNEIFAEYSYVEFQRVPNDADFFRDGAPSSSFLDVLVDKRNEFPQPIEELASLGMAYDDHHAYL